MKTVKRTLAVVFTLLMLMSVAVNVGAVSATWTINSTTDITDTNAKISGKVTFGSQQTCTEGGFYLGTSSGNLKKNSYPDKGFSIKSTYITCSFLMSKYKETLKPNTTYYFKIYVIANGTQYTSPEKSFKTNPDATWTINSVTNISTTDAKISCRVDFPQSRTCTESGFYIGTSSGNLRKNAHPDSGLSIKSSYITSSFLMSKYKETLSPNTTYYYKFYVVMNGATYTSPVANFKTLPVPTQNYTLIYNANGGSGAPAAQSNNSTYTISSTVPTRNGYKFLGWATSSSASSAEYVAGNKITLTKNTTLYAVWASTTGNPFNLGEETYSFKNYPCNPHGYNCFGMSATCSGFYIGALNLADVGAAGKKVHDLTLTSTLKNLICKYQGRQSAGTKAIVAGGTAYKSDYKKTNIQSDWTEVINYVKNHSHDGKGDLQIGIRQGNGGHAFNFLYYKEVNGEARIYAYDNTHPGFEIYLFKDSNGRIRRMPTSGTEFSMDTKTLINCIALRDMVKYFKLVDNFKETRVIYADKGSIDVVGIDPFYLEAEGEEEDSKVMYEIPDYQEEVTIIPLVQNAGFEYLEEEYAFGEITENTYGIFTLINEDDTGVSIGAGLTIYEREPGQNDSNLCKWCGKTHDSGFIQKIIAFFHNILASIFGAKY